MRIFYCELIEFTVNLYMYTRLKVLPGEWFYSKKNRKKVKKWKNQPQSAANCEASKQVGPKRSLHMRWRDDETGIFDFISWLIKLGCSPWKLTNDLYRTDLKSASCQIYSVWYSLKIKKQSTPYKYHHISFLVLNQRSKWSSPTDVESWVSKNGFFF